MRAIVRSIALLAVVLLALAGEAKAWTAFGTAEDIHPIENVTLTGPDGEALFLGYKTSTVYFLGGVWLSDDGYVLGLQADSARFLDMPPPETLAQFQAQGLVPNPLPPYSLGILDYLNGFSLWIVLVVLVAGYVAVLIGRRRSEQRSY